jgi:hypothetical protein
MDTEAKVMAEIERLKQLEVAYGLLQAENARLNKLYTHENKCRAIVVAENADLLRDFRLAHAELDRIRPATQEAKDLLWKMQDVPRWSDEINYVGALLNVALTPLSEKYDG